MAKKQTKKPAGRNARAPQRSNEVVLAAHPRAQRQIGLAKSYAGLIAFALAGWSAYQGGQHFLDVASRALMWGMAAYLLVWALAVHVWRHLAVAEVRAAEKRWERSRSGDEEQVAKLTKILEDNNMPTSGTGAMPPM
jgi:hypothetical protein